MTITTREDALTAAGNIRAWALDLMADRAIEVAELAGRVIETGDAIRDLSLRESDDIVELAGLMRRYALRLGAPEEIVNDLAPSDLEGWKTRLKLRVTAYAERLMAARYTREQEVAMQRRYRAIVQKLFAVREGAAVALTTEEWDELDAISTAAALSEAIMDMVAFKRAEIDALEDAGAVRAYDFTLGWPA